MAMISSTINLIIPAGKATPAPPIGPALGQRGVSSPEFCKQFNAVDTGYPLGTPIPVVISVNRDKSFSFITKKPPVAYLVMNAAGIQKGSPTTGRLMIAKISLKKIMDIALEKMDDLNSINPEACISMVKGTAMSMGIEIVENE